MQKIWIGVLCLGLPLGVWAMGQMGALAGSPPTDLGAPQGQLKAPSLTRNSVSSQASRHPDHPQMAYADIAPLPLLHGDAQASWQRLTQLIQSQSNMQVRQLTPNYMWAQARTRWLGFVDDVEFVLAADEGVIHVRSASRLGREDFGTNRKRVTCLAQRYASSDQSGAMACP